MDQLHYFMIRVKKSHNIHSTAALNQPVFPDLFTRLVS